MANTRSQSTVTMWAAVCTACVLWSEHAWATESPLEVIRNATQQAAGMLHSSTEQGRENHAERIEQMWQTILPYFDTQEIAQRSLGVHWQRLTEEQRHDFTQQFLQLVKANYSHTLARYTRDTQFFFDQESVDGDFAQVRTRIVPLPQNRSFAVVYHLHRKGDAWKVYDVVAENVSMVRNYRTQFNRIINKSSYQGLIEAMEKKLQGLRSTAAS